ncbi:EamA-like transporter family protein [Enhydrobacter aerosaccus]|uniref:EamA-like transporter family protein n=1 Tax=Enhydrobacter aerosaccus TaxID=225324 RepID=A0A1T4JKW9_9HYPH|nr:DMT family transporter [Enhydrobacter aerosaccus]SJZ30791.1 EamA-like transporter family protein [Enhydrobacter aerosaccus]
MRALPIAYLVLAAVSFGATFCLNKLAAEGGIPPLAYAFWQTGLSGLLLLVIALARGHRVPRNANALKVYVLVGVLGLGLPAALLTFVAPHLPAGLVTLVLALSPPITFLLAVAFRLQAFLWLGLGGVALGFAGILVLVAPGSTALPSSEALGWFALCLIAPCLYATANVSAAVFQPPSADSVALAAGILLGAAAGLLPLAALSGQLAWMPHGVGDAEIAIGLSIFIYAGFTWLFLEIVRMAGPTFFAQFNYLAIVAGLGWGWIIFLEPVQATTILALVLMVLGIVLLSVANSRPAPAQMGTK